MEYSFFHFQRTKNIQIENLIRSKLKYAITGSKNTMESRRSNSGGTTP